MGDDEKVLQVGLAVSEYQAAKVNCAHIDKKIDRVFRAYRAAGETMDVHSRRAEPKLIDGKVKFDWCSYDVSTSDILNESDLAVLLAERDAARKRLEEAKNSMHSLGMTSVS